MTDSRSNRRILPLPGRRAHLALDRHRDRIRAQRPRQDEDADAQPLVRLAARRIPVGHQQPGHRVFRRDAGEVQRVVGRLPQHRADRSRRSAARHCAPIRVWRGRARSRSSRRVSSELRGGFLDDRRPSARRRRSHRVAASQPDWSLAAAAGERQRKACDKPEQQAVMSNGHGNTLGAAPPTSAPRLTWPALCQEWSRHGRGGIRRQIVGANLAAVRGRIAAAARGRRPARPTRSPWSRSARPIRPPRCAPRSHAGQRVFGENRVQEALGKFPELRGEFPDLVLHLIGPLQTNKVKDAVALCDVIETVDRPRLAEALARRDGTHRPAPALLHRGQYRRGAAKGRRLAGRRRRFHPRLPRPARPRRSPG